ncbi:hypothetical protein E2493_09410 [Sphingomonas parva]|uniref:Uncharacterized protein n=1 Tax=Sphingomonas parva TaxID=2555898 RepID=A0A4Y8ZW13_9SPHN|nr:DUF6361 family protein [Sphingomonas parva]TFI58626.1 hypothetical protein E2493_09410 [Sphingomonas parva]
MRFLGWIDHDPQQQQSVLSGLTVKGQDARDELGLGTVRDTLSDLLFPGTSTIQQRVRYFLFVQWCCELAARRSGADRILEELRRLETELIKTLTPLGEGEGVIGLLSQDELERMPSEIYWNGLLAVGMRRVSGNRGRWAREVASQRTASASDPWAERADRSSEHGFDVGRPGPPAEFPRTKGLDFRLSCDEAEYLRHRLESASADPDGHGRAYSLFPAFLSYRRPTEACAAWEHPRANRLSEPARGLLAFAAAFSRVMLGATHLYNARVAELALAKKGSSEVRDRHVALLRDWRGDMDIADVELVLARLDEIPPLGLLVRHRIRPETVAFVRNWAVQCHSPGDLLKRRAAVELVERREVFLKGAAGTSRILSEKARARWGGESGGALDYRWRVVRRCLNDLAKPG